MPKCFSIVLCLFLLPPISRGNGIVVDIAKKGNHETDPGRVLTIALTVQNTTPGNIDLQPTWHLPSGWKHVTPGGNYSIPGNQTMLKLFSVQIPQGTPAGSYEAIYRLLAPTGYEILGEVIIPVEVHEVDRIYLTDVNGPDHVIAGEPITVDFLVRNAGNKAREIKLKPGHCKLEGTDVVYLEPGDSKLVKVKATTSESARTLNRQILTLSASVTDNETVSERASRLIKVIPRSEQSDPGMPEIPGVITLRHLIRDWGYEGARSGVQGQLFLSGTLDEEDRHQVELKLKGPNGLDADYLGLYEEYFASYNNDKLSIFAGDKAYHATPLTELSRYGRGVEFRLQNNGAEIGGFYMRPRFFPSISEEIAGHMKFRLSEENNIGFHILHKRFAENREAILGSIVSSFRLLQKTWIEAELSSGNSEKRSGRGFGFRILSAPIERLQANANLSFTSKDYPGYYSNTWNVATSLNYQLFEKVNLSVNYNQDDRNAARDTLYGASPFSKMTLATLQYRITPATMIKGQLRHHEIKDRMPDQKFHYLERVARLQAEQQAENVRATLALETGDRENFLAGNPAGERIKALRSFLNVNYQYASKHSVDLILQHHQYKNPGEPADRQWIYGARLNSAFSYSTSLRLSFQNRYVIEEYYRNRSLLNLNLDQKLGKEHHHQLSVTANYVLLQRTEHQTEFSALTTYSWLFGIRKGPRPPRQGLQGRIRKEGSASVEGIVLNLNGRLAVTGKDGQFSFDYLPPGTYMLTLDPTSVGLHQVPTVPMPVEVVIEPGVYGYVVFGLTDGAAIGGKVRIQADNFSKSIDASSETRKLIMVEITNGEQTFRRITDEQYSFEFPDILPGQWNIRIVNPKDYEGYYFEQTSWNVQLSSGEKKDLDIHMMKKKKTIRFQQSLGPSGKGN